MITRSVYGPMHTFGSDDFISRCLIEYGEWGFVETQIVRSVLKEDDVLYDIGAFLGTFSLAFIGFPLKKIVAVEASRDAYNLLKLNIANNIFDRFSVHNAFVSSQRGFAALNIDDTNEPKLNLGSRTFRTVVGPSSTPLVPSLTLRDLRESDEDYSFLKLDIEGGELSALVGDALFIRQKRPRLWIECNQRPDVCHILDFLRWANYDIVYAAFPAFRANNTKNRDILPYPIAYEAALFAGSKSDVEALFEHRFPECILKHVTDHASLREAMWRTPRWGETSWVDLSAAELIGLLGRHKLNEDYSNFLN